MAQHIWSDEREEPITKNTLPRKTLVQIWWGNHKPSKQAEVKRILALQQVLKELLYAGNTREG